MKGPAASQSAAGCGPLSPFAPARSAAGRTAALKDRILSAPYEICIQRARYFTEVYRRTEGEHPSLRSARALARTLEQMDIYILPEERLAGNRSSKVVGAVLPVERGEMNVVLKMDLDELERRRSRPFRISAADKRELLEEILPYWEGRTVRDYRAARWAERLESVRIRHGLGELASRYRAMGAANLLKLARTFGNNPRRLRTGGREVALNNPGLVMNIFDVQGHMVLGHQHAIRTGFRGIREEARARLEALRRKKGTEQGTDGTPAHEGITAHAGGGSRRPAKGQGSGHGPISRTEDPVGGARRPPRGQGPEHGPISRTEDPVGGVGRPPRGQGPGYGLGSVSTSPEAGGGGTERFPEPQGLEKDPAGRDADGIAFLEAVILCCDAIRDFALRFAVEAERLAQSEVDPGRRAELQTIANHCRRVPWEPPRGFHEALQFLWLTQVTALIAHGMGGIFAIGRPDQYLLPFYEQDLSAGRIDPATATELVEELLVKLSCNLLILPSYAKNTASELGADNQAVTLGGVDREGRDAVNPLTYIFLDAVRNVRNLSNSISIRVHAGAPAAYWERVAEVVTATAGPALFNDEAVIPALLGDGYTLEDARDYAIIGCVEPTSAGNTFGCTSGNDVSLVGALEMVFNRGKVRMAGAPIGPATGDPEGFRSFEDFWDAYRQQLEACVDLIAEGVNVKDRVYAEHFPCPYVSALLQGCVENARDMTQGGARYNFGSISGRGLATAADSLTAVRKLVFEQQRVTMQELRRALEHNFRGQESLRLQLRQSPRYGNDDPEADGMARRLADLFCRTVSGHRNVRGGAFRPGFFSYGMHVYEGSILGATPDGRKAGLPISNSLSPSNGSERKGATATLKSAARIEHRRISNGSSLNLKLSPAPLRSEAGRARLVALLRTYFELGGMHVQINTIAGEVLREAQKHPECYPDLVVRVSGYSAYFVDLGKAIQDDILARTEFQGL